MSAPLLTPPALAAFADPAVLPDPYPVLAGLREASPFAGRTGLCWSSAGTRTAPRSCATSEMLGVPAGDHARFAGRAGADRHLRTAETLRYDAPVQFSGRVARAGMQVGPVSAPDGAFLLAAAGRDPEVLEAPDSFDIRRGAANYLAFAAGPHFCLGAPLARLEAAIAVRAFATRVCGAELDPAGLAYKPNLNLRGPSRLLVHFAQMSRPHS
jgi:hypothetical protein